MSIEPLSATAFAASTIPSPQSAATPPAPGQAPATPEAAAAQRIAYPNPSSRLDPELNMVIMEFRAPDGRVTETLPTSQQLQQFRQTLDNQPAADSKAAAPISQWS